MKELDDQEKRIVLELIKDARISDNQLARKAKIPVATVNRKRKQLEEEGIINYFTHINNWKNGTEIFGARQLYIVKLRHGITRKQFLDNFHRPERISSLQIKHVLSSYLGEMNGQLAIIYIIESRLDTDIIEIFNAEIAPELEKALGRDPIQEAISMPLTHTLATFHNYSEFNVQNARIRPNWPSDKIFVQ